MRDIKIVNENCQKCVKKKLKINLYLLCILFITLLFIY